MFIPGDLGTDNSAAAGSVETTGGNTAEYNEGASVDYGGIEHTSTEALTEGNIPENDSNPLLDYYNNAYEGGTGTAGQEQGQEFEEPGTNEDPTTLQGGEAEQDGAQEGQFLSPVPQKFMNADGTLNQEALLQSYSFLEEKLGQQGNQLGQMSELAQQNQQYRQQLGQLNNYVQQIQVHLLQQQQAAQQAQLQTEQVPPQMTEEEIREMNERFTESFYENPQDTLNNFVRERWENYQKEFLEKLQPVLRPVLEDYGQRQAMQSMAREADALKASLPEGEFDNMRPYMNKVVQDQAHVLDNLPPQVKKWDYIYQQAKALHAQENIAKMQEQMKSPEEWLLDPEFQQKIMANPQIQQLFTQSQVEAIKNNRPPTVIGNQPTGQAPAAPPQDVRTIKDATPKAINFFNKVLGNK